MLLQPKGNTNVREQFHVPSGIGKALIATGVVEEVVLPAKPVAASVVRWSAFVSAPPYDMYPPVVSYKCSGCNQSGHQESQRGTAHQTAKFMHCGKTEVCPADVAEKYLTLWNQYAARTRRR